MRKFRSSTLNTWSIVAFLAAVLAFPPSDAEAGKFKVLHSFCETDADGCIPMGGLVMDPNGNLYGTTVAGGGSFPYNHGTVYELRRTDTGKLKYNRIFSFCKKPNHCTGISSPVGNLIVDTEGNLYGLAGKGGNQNSGSVFEVSPPTDGSTKWTGKVLYWFCSQQNCKDGSQPIGALTYDGKEGGLPYNGTSPLYGATEVGGVSFAGTVYELTNSGGNWSQTVLYNFCSEGNDNCTDGKWPMGGLLLDRSGSMFGTTEIGGANAVGTVFELIPNGDGTWNRNTLYSFCAVANCNDGGFPFGDLVADAAGALFGVAGGGGNNCKPDPSGCGVVYKLVPNGINSQETVLYAFCSRRACRDGNAPRAGLLLDSSGNLYGTTYFGGGNDIDVNHLGGGVAFELASSYSVLHSFCALTNCADGEYPQAGLTMDASGALLGTTSFGGAFGSDMRGGTVFELKPR